MKTHWSDRLAGFAACPAGTLWARTVDTPEHAWVDCPRGDWLLCIAARCGVNRRLVVRAACACARTALEFVPAGEDRPLRAIETAEAWTRRAATSAQVRVRARAARAASKVETDPDIARAAAYVTYLAVRSVTDGIDYVDVDYVSIAAVDVSVDYYGASTRASVRRHHADLVRGIIKLSDLRWERDSHA